MLRWKPNLGIKFRSDFWYREPTLEGGLTSRIWYINGLIQRFACMSAFGVYFGDKWNYTCQVFPPHSLAIKRILRMCFRSLETSCAFSLSRSYGLFLREKISKTDKIL